ncbi:hypothetical protein BASA81_001077 [Batrachochytrium salamandrivorans]|nr:hypothetical protein BASA81_001077 [Batrachochytrium salamandrivorans]
MISPAVSTGTVCPFPMVWPSSVNDSEATLLDCTETYAQRLGTGFAVFRALCVFIPLVVGLVLVFQLYKLKLHVARQSSLARMRDHSSFPFFINALIFNLLLFLQHIDLFGFYGLMPIQVYFTLSELSAASFMIMAVLLVDFWMRCAKFGAKHGFPPKMLALFLCLVVFNFLAWTFISFGDLDRFVMYRTIKFAGGAILVLGFFLQAARSVRQMHHTLSSSSKGINDSNDVQKKRMVRALVRKFYQFSVILFFAMLAMLMNAILGALKAAKTGIWNWHVSFFDQLEPLPVVVRVAFLLGCVASLLFFRVPPTDSNKPVGEHMRSPMLSSKLGVTSYGSKEPMSPENKRRSIPF